MPARNWFRHQSYPTCPASVPVRQVLQADPGPADFRRLHADHGIRRVILVPGTFTGSDPFHAVDTLKAAAERLPVAARPVRHLADRLAEKTHEVFRGITGDVGNYVPEFAEQFRELVGRRTDVELLHPPWSGQNHHFARADLAVRLLVHLNGLNLSPEERVMVWGHSHAGNGLALLSNLLANDRDSTEEFFAVCRSGPPDAPAPWPSELWREAAVLLRNSPSPHPLAGRLVAVTFGTPVRYGWDTDGLAGLIHVLFDRHPPSKEQFTTQPLFPPHSFRDMIDATWGDWVQAFAISGTDFVPPIPGAMKRHRRLSAFLQRGLEPPPPSADTRRIPAEPLRHLCGRWKTGTRCHSDGRNLLVDYRPCGRMMRGRPVEVSVFGHGVATTLDWLPAHLKLVLNHLDRTLPVPRDRSDPAPGTQ